MTSNQEPIIVDYCKEAMELHLSKLPAEQVDQIVYNIALLVNGRVNSLDIVWTRINDKTNEPYKVKVPAMAFLRTDSIKNRLVEMGISKSTILGYINKSTTVEISSDGDPRPTDLNEVKHFIFEALREKYGDAIISNTDTEAVINTRANYTHPVEVWVKLRNR